MIHFDFLKNGLDGEKAYLNSENIVGEPVIYIFSLWISVKGQFSIIRSCYHLKIKPELLVSSQLLHKYLMHKK